MDVSIIIPTKNAGEFFRQVLEAVFHQITACTYEVICIDSGSADQTLDIIRSYPQIRLYQIPAEEFGHGKTRQYGASLSEADFVVFITQDALPASEDWLDQMISAIKADDQCALCFGIHYPYPDCNPLDRRDITAHFKGFGLCNTYYSLDDPERYKTDEAYRHMLAFSSDNNACVRRSVLEKIPYPDAEFAEDQIWARTVLEKGYKKVYCPLAPVYHSHNFPMNTCFKRYYDEYKGLREIHGYRMITKKRAILPTALRLFRSDVVYIRQQPMTYKEKAHWCWYALRRDGYRCLAGYIGGKYRDYPEAKQRRLDRRISQQFAQRNQKTVKQGQPAAYGDYRKLWQGQATAGEAASGQGQMTRLDKAYGFVMDTETVPFSRRQFQAAGNEPITLHWVIPEPGVGSGGHLNIFRFIGGLQQRGIRNRIYVENAARLTTDQKLTAFIHKNYPILPREIELFHSCDKMPFCHGIVATGWNTAYFVRRFENTISRFYFVQDFEPLFYPMGSEYKFAENTYRFGFRGITAGDWLKNKLEREYGMRCDSFHFSYDKDLYHAGTKKDKKKRIFFYARPVTPRRAWELGLLSLMALHRKIPDLEVIFAGWDVSNYYIPFAHQNLGSVPIAQLSDLYAQCDICLVMSLTNLSLLPLEVMASGSVIATQEDENNAWMINSSNAVIIDSDPVHIADTLADCLDHPEKLETLRENGLRFAAETDWDREIDKVYNSIVEGIKEDGKAV